MGSEMCIRDSPEGGVNWVRQPISKLLATRSCGPIAKLERRMPRIAALVLRAHIHDQRLAMLHFHLERGHQGVLGIDLDMVSGAVEFVANGKSHHRCSLSANSGRAYQMRRRSGNHGRRAVRNLQAVIEGSAGDSLDARPLGRRQLGNGGTAGIG